MSSKLREVRLAKEMSQWKLAKISGVQQSRISMYENDLYPLTEAHKVKLAIALDISKEELFPTISINCAAQLIMTESSRIIG